DRREHALLHQPLEDVVGLDAEHGRQRLDGNRLRDLDRLALLDAGLRNRVGAAALGLLEVAVEGGAGGAGGVERVAPGDEIGFGKLAELFHRLATAPVVAAAPAARQAAALL